MAQAYFINNTIQSATALVSFIYNSLYSSGWEYYGRCSSDGYIFVSPAQLTQYPEVVRIYAPSSSYIRISIGYNPQGTGSSFSFVEIARRDIGIYSTNYVYLTVDDSYFSILLFRISNNIYVFNTSVTVATINYSGDLLSLATTNDVEAGYNVVIPVQDASNVYVNSDLIIISGQARDLFTVTDVSSNSIIANVLFDNYPAGSIILRNFPATVFTTASGVLGVTPISLLSASSVYNALKYPMLIKPVLGVIPIATLSTDKLYQFSTSTFSSYYGGMVGNYLCDGIVYSGTVTSGSSSSLTDTNASFEENALIDKYVIIHKANGSNFKDSISKITSNTSTTINFIQFDTTVAGGDIYTVCSAPYKILDNTWVLKHDFSYMSVA